MMMKGTLGCQRREREQERDKEQVTTTMMVGKTGIYLVVTNKTLTVYMFGICSYYPGSLISTMGQCFSLALWP